AGSGMAEVSLTFENTRNLLPTEFTTVTISRKFYKNGESEYRLNDVPCRLKDIHNLFLDTGVSNDSYAIIELGMVDDIIKDKDGSRRRMLEQAAGISIYKTRKKEAKLKLDATQQDIARIEDLLFEIGNNLRTLESQARKAERYFQIKNEYREVSIELAKASLEQFNEQYKELNEQHDKETDRKLALDASLSTEEATIEKQKLTLTAREQELTSLQKQFNELINRIRQLESDKKLASQRMEHLRERERNIREFLQKADGQLQQLQDSLVFIETQTAEETTRLDAMKDQMETLRDLVDEKRAIFDEKKKVLEALRNEYQQKQRLVFDAEKKVAVADTSLTNLQRSIHHLREEQDQRHAQIDQINHQKELLEIEVKEQQERLTYLQNRQEEVKNKILENQELLENTRSTLIEENRKLDAKRNEHDLLKSLVESLEGYPDSIKFLKKNKDWNNEAPLLSDVFVVEPAYRVALENLLDNYLNYYLVNSVEDAVQAIQLLDQHKKGKANFFVLNQFNQENSPSAPQADNLIPALSVVHVDEVYKPLAQHLLGHVYIASDDTQLPEYPQGENWVIISPSGKMIRGKYTLSGGSTGLFEGNKIGRAKNLERLAEEIQELTTVTQKLKQEIADTQTKITGFNAELNDKAIDQTKQEINRLQNQITNYSYQVENFTHLNLTAAQRLSQQEEQMQQTHDDIAQTREELSQLTEVLAGITQQIREAENTFQIAEQAYNLANQEYNQIHIQQTRQQSKIDNLRQEFSFRTNQLNDLQLQIKSNKEQLQQTTVQIAETEGKLHGGDTELYELMSKKEKDEQILNEKDRLYYVLRNEIAAQESQLNQKRREKEQTETLLSHIKDQLNEMKLRLSGLKERLYVE